MTKILKPCMFDKMSSKYYTANNRIAQYLVYLGFNGIGLTNFTIFYITQTMDYFRAIISVSFQSENVAISSLYLFICFYYQYYFLLSLKWV
jgi:hypothetical protein